MPDRDDERPEQAEGGTDSPRDEELSSSLDRPEEEARVPGPQAGEAGGGGEDEAEGGELAASPEDPPAEASPEASGGEATAEADAEAANGDGNGDEDGEDLLAALVAEIDAEVEATPGEEAGRRRAGEEVAEEDRYVVFDLEGSHYAVPIDNITEVGTVPELTPLPNVPPWLKGVTNLRGDILSVTDVRGFLGLEPAAQPEAGRLLVARSLADGMAAGLLVDRVAGMLSIPRSGIGDPAAPIEDRVSEYLAGVYRGEERLIGVLDLERMLQAPEFREFEPV